MAGKVWTAKGIDSKTFQKGQPPLFKTGQDRQLIRLWAKLRLIRINGGLQVPDFSQAVHMAFATEQIAAFNDLLNQFLEVNRPEFPRIPGPDAFEWHQDPVGIVKFGKDGIASAAGGGPMPQAVFAISTQLCQTLLDGGLIGQK